MLTDSHFLARNYSRLLDAAQLFFLQIFSSSENDPMFQSCIETSHAPLNLFPGLEVAVAANQKIVDVFQELADAYFKEGDRFKAIGSKKVPACAFRSCSTFVREPTSGAIRSG